jgi:hypothetical protein
VQFSSPGAGFFPLSIILLRILKHRPRHLGQSHVSYSNPIKSSTWNEKTKVSNSNNSCLFVVDMHQAPSQDRCNDVLYDASSLRMPSAENSRCRKDFIITELLAQTMYVSYDMYVVNILWP